MFETLNSVYDGVATVLASNPAVAAVFSLWGLATVSFLFWKTPKRLFSFIWRQMTSTFIFKSQSITWTSYNERQWVAFLDWFSKNSWFKWSRIITIEGKCDMPEEENAGEYQSYINVGPGVGTHFFIFKRHLFYFQIGEVEKTGSSLSAYTLTMTCFSRNKKWLYEVLDQFLEKPDASINSISVYASKPDGDWIWTCKVMKRNLNTVVVNADLKDSVLQTMDHFFESRSWYEDRGLTYKKTFLLTGPPGTGKTSFIKALASHYNKSVYMLDLSTMTSLGLKMALSRAKNGFIVIEDVDSFKATNQRKVVLPASDPNTISHSSTPRPAEVEDMGFFETLTLSDVLNAFDGIATSSGMVIFMTSNYPEKLDSALTRKGRVDETFKLEALGNTEIRAYIKMMYPELDIPDIQFSPIAGCDIQALFLEHRDPDEFLAKVKEKCGTT